MYQLDNARFGWNGLLLCSLATLLCGPASACFSPRIGTASCGPDRECPIGLACSSDNMCREPGDWEDEPDAGAANLEADHSPGEATPEEPPALTLEFHRKPRFGSEWGGNPEQKIEGVELQLRAIRLISGVEGAEVAELELPWPDDSPDKIRTMVRAPFGIYSRVELVVESYSLRGTSVVGQGPAMGFEIVDAPDMAVTVNLPDLSFEPGGANTIHIDIEVKPAVDIDWSLVTPTNNVRVLTDPAMLASVAGELRKGFRIP